MKYYSVHVAAMHPANQRLKLIKIDYIEFLDA
jgi:hypothetical protein